ncbi:lysophospholipid acyltransferase family protein [Fodinibius sediminis]|uniref:1-acyl-sn-glycerol-3-phosphate acyltransferase n=1 Tax=Fodinibius sediminis TaxID=1214077 RepID=A0A521E5C7_9BACT|nr:lysophospholipid acyltransferase family protein [Fodinibius sediminis]SMO78360.1 1-acyl-sn-glycerol-3-phosphate acyltransferase [Fodinibius sediminis]
MDFIPAKESPFFITLFRYYTRFLFKRRFSRVWLKQGYSPGRRSKAIYYLNHHSWWDGLIPFLLNEYRFHQQARALMEDKQMRAYRFFQKIGAFSINRADRRSAIRSLRYAVASFERPRASLFIYPEGTITPAGSALEFEGGLAWLSQQLPQVDVVPIGIYMHTIRRDKPELHLQVGSPVEPPPTLSTQERTHRFEQELETIIADLRQHAGFNDSIYERFL